MPKIKLVILVAVVSVAIAAVVLAGVAVAFGDAREHDRNTSIRETEDDPVMSDIQTPAFNPAPPYLVKLYNNRVAVYGSGKTEGEPDDYIDADLNLLNDEDILLLSQGIILESYEELLMLTEDLTS